MLERAKLALSASSDKDFAHKLGINASTVVGYKQRGVVPLEQCIKIAEQTGVSLDWLILGKGKAPNNPVTTWHTVIERHTINGQTVETRRRRRTAVNANENKAPKIPGIENKTFETNFGINIDDEKIRLVPLYDVPVSAGYGSFFDEENIIQRIPFDAEWLEREELGAERLACLPIKGDSMSPGLKTSDIVLIDLTHQRGDGVFVLRLNGALRIKRLQWLADGRLRISSDNPIYETEYVDPNTPPDDFAIIGFCHTKIGRVV